MSKRKCCEDCYKWDDSPESVDIGIRESSYIESEMEDGGGISTDGGAEIDVESSDGIAE